MKIGVVGLGFMGTTHLRAYQNIPEAELVAVSSDDEKALAGDFSHIAGNLGREAAPIELGDAARYSDGLDLIADANVEAVDLAVPSFLHASMTVRALEAGKHVIVEKPMALSAADCDRMIATSRKAGKVLMVAQVLRFWPEYGVTRKMVRSGELGRPLTALFRRKCAAPPWSKWMKDRTKSGGGVFDLLIHDLDFCQWTFGLPKAVEARGYESLEKGIDIVEARLDYPDGPLVTVSGGWHHPDEYPFSMEFTIVCEGGTLDFNSALRKLKLYRADGTAEELDLPEVDGFEAELKAFLEACGKGEAPADCRPEDSAEAIRMTLAMRASREQGGEPTAP